MTISALSATAGSNNVLSALAQVSTSTTQLAVTKETSEIDTAIQNRLNTEIAAIEAPPDSAVSNAQAAQITALQTQQSQISALGPQYGANTNVLSDLQNQLATLQTAASNGDSDGFDAALSQANTDLTDLTPVNASSPFQPDGIAALLTNGLGIGDSTSYGLDTPDGQAAAEAAVTNAQNTVAQIFAVTDDNQLLAGDLSSALSTQISQLQALQQQQESSSQATIQARVQQLTQQAQEQEHVIELALGNTTTIASSIFNADNPPAAATSPLAVLQDAVGATAASSTATANAAPPILSLLS